MNDSASLNDADDAGTDHCVSYNVDLPNRTVLSRKIAAARLVMVVSTIGCLWNAFAALSDRYDDFEVYRTSECPSGDVYFNKFGEYVCTRTDTSILVWSYHHWYVVVALAISSAIIGSVYSDRFKMNFRTVRQGKIVDKDTEYGGRFPLEWVVLVEGNTNANELRRQWKHVSHGTYEKSPIGSFIDFR